MRAFERGRGRDDYGRRIYSSKVFYHWFFTLALSIALQNLLTYGVNLTDNLMLGAYQENALSAAALCNQVQFLLQMLVMGAGDGILALGTQYWGKGQTEPVTHIIGIALRVSLAIVTVIFLAVLIVPGQILGLLTSEQVIIYEGIKYFQIVCFTYPIFALTNVLAVSLRSVGVVKIGYLISGSTLCINLGLNYCLIYGNLGFAELGIRGAAIATLVSRTVELIILTFYFRRKHSGLSLTLQTLLHPDRRYYPVYIKTAIPVLFNQLQWGLAQMVQTAVLGHLGRAAITANSIAVLVFQVLSVVVYGAAGAAAIIVGKTIGEGRQGQLKQLVSILQKLFLVLGVISGALILGVREIILTFYQISAESQVLTRQFITILAITTIGTSYQMACDTGIIKGGGDTLFGAKLNFFSMWGIVVPLSCIAAFYLRLTPPVVFFLLKWDQIYKCIPVAIHLYRWRWVRTLTREPLDTEI